MRSTALTLNTIALACLVCAPAAHAQFLGTQATGAIYFNGGTINYFDPTNGAVPDGYLNKTEGTMVTVAEPAIEFGAGDQFDTDAVNITANSLILSDAASSGVGTVYPFIVTITDTGFAGFTISKTSDDFANGGITYTRTGNTLSFSMPGFTGSGSGSTSTAVFSIPGSSVPEPGSLALLIGAGLSGGTLLWKRRRKNRPVA